MFEHLDDRGGYRPSTAMLATVTRDGRRRRRRARVTRAGTASVAALALGAGVAVTSFNRKLDSVERVEVAALADDPPAPGEPYTILLVGLDAAVPATFSVPYAPNGEQREIPMSQRTDTIALVRVDPAADEVRYLSVPRDLWVDVPDQGEARINTAVLEAGGGPGLLIETLRQNFGIEVDRYVGLDFAGAQALGNAVGGLRFAFDHPTRDRSTGLSVDAGCQTLDGSQALALARARRLEVETAPGVWEGDPTADHGRMARQHQVAMAGLAAFSALDPSDPAEVTRFVDAVVDNVVLDAETDRDEMVDIFRNVAGSRIEELWLPVEEHETPTGAMVLRPTSDGALEQVLERFLSGGTDDDPVDGGSAAPQPPDVVTSAIIPRPC